MKNIERENIRKFCKCIERAKERYAISDANLVALLEMIKVDILINGGHILINNKVGLKKNKKNDEQMGEDY